MVTIALDKCNSGPLTPELLAALHRSASGIDVFNSASAVDIQFLASPILRRHLMGQRIFVASLSLFTSMELEAVAASIKQAS